jgi:hypothetical protein
MIFVVHQQSTDKARGIPRAGCVLLTGLVALLSATNVRAQSTQPLVAIHDSELTRGLDSTNSPAIPPTPNGVTNTGLQWWPTNFHYHVMPESVKETLRSDGTAFVTVSDANITAGALLTNGQPKYPILISLASEAIRNDEIAPLTNYVAAGGFLFIGSSSFTRNTNGTTRTNFAFATEMGMNMVVQGLTNWTSNNNFTKQVDHRLIDHIPGGALTWRMPTSAEEISWGTSPSHPYLAPHLIWQVQATTATVLAQGDSLPYLLVKPYGKGFFIYYAPMQPLLGHGGWAPGMYAYGTLRKAIEWAFESTKVPVTKLSPWPFPYDSAFMVRHDLEDYSDEIANIRASAIAENSVGAKGDYFFCTGTLRVDMAAGYSTNTVITNIRDAMINYGATVSSHNGGLRNPNNPSLTNLDYDFWHWGPDEAMDITNAISGYPNGKAYALASVSNSFNDIEGWFPGLMTNTMRSWVTPYFNGTREDSMDIQSQLGVKITGDIKLSPFPGWMYSTATPGKRYPILNIPVSDWYVSGQVAQSIDALNLHTSASVHALVDYYYGMGALINLYSHTLSTGQGPAGALVPDYINYCLNTNLHPRLWAANSLGIYQWWLQRSNAVISVTTTNSAGGVSATTITVSGATDPSTAVELVLPAGGTIAALQVKTNGVVDSGGSWRTNGQVLKVKVGTTVTNAVVSYVLGPKGQGEFYTTGAGNPLTVPAPGVLANDSPGLGGSNLTAVLISGVSHGVLNLSTNGGFTYTPANGFSGFDGFTYQVNDTQTNSASVVALVSVTPPGSYFFDDFVRPAGADPLIPWVVQLGDWAITNGVLMGASDAQSYGFAYITNSWSDYSVQAQVKIPSGGYGGGIGGRLNTATGTHYAVWIYPENSVGGSKVIKLIKFTSWSLFTTLQQANLSGTVADAFHTIKLTMNGINITVSYDGTQLLNVNDGGMGGYSSGSVNAGMWTFATPYNMQIENVLVTPITTAIIANNDSYSVTQGQTLTVNAPGVLGNDSGGSGTLSAALITGPTHGNFSLTSNGSFTYTPTNNYVGQDSFTYQATDGITNSPAAAVTITVNAAPPPVANNDSYTYTLNTPLVVAAPGVLANDTDPNGSNLVAVLVVGPSGGSLNLNSNGGFTYTPANGFIGNDSFTYRAADGLTNSSTATVNLSAALVGALFGDDFTRSNDPTNLTAPWVVRSNNWTVTGGLLQGGVDALNSYGSAYVTNSWSNYYVQARLMFGPGGYGGGIGGRLNPTTGARYVAWVYPSPSSEGNNAISLVKFSDWTSWGYTNTPFQPIAQVSVGTVGTIWHTVRLAFHGSRIAIYYDGVQVISVTDNDTAPVYTNGGISLDMYTSISQQYVMSVDDVVVNNLVVNDSYSVTGSQPLNVSASGVLGNDTAVYTTNLAASLVSGPTNGSLTLNSNGGFSYTMTNSAALDTFTYQALDGITNLGPATVTIGQTLQSQTITFGPLGNKTYGDAPFGLSATASSGLPVSFSVLSGPAVITNTTLTITGAGTVVVRASQAGNSTYAAAPNVDQSFTVNPAPLTVTANNQARLYGATNPVLTVSYSGFVNGENSSVLGGTPTLNTAATTNSTVGTYAITVTNGTLAAANYSFAFVSGTLTVNKAALSVTANNQARAYGATNPVLTVSYTGFVNGENSSVLGGNPSVTTTAVTNSPVGSYTIAATNGALASANYNFSFVSGTLTVNKASLTVTADNQARLYGATNPVLTVSYGGFVNGENSGVLTGNPALSTTATTNSTAGSYPITVTNGTLASANYSFSFVNGMLTVNKAALTVTADNQVRLYGATNPVLTVSYSGFVNGENSGVLTGNPTVATTATTNSAAGSYSITATNGTLASSNYNFNFVAGTLTVNKASLTVTADNQNRLYGATNPVLTVSYSGFANGETSGVLAGAPSVTTIATTNSAAGSYSITVTNGTLASSNYNFSFVAGTLAVNKALLTVTADNQVRLYGATNPVLTVSYSGFANGETASVLAGSPTVSTTATTNSAAGNYGITVTNGTLASSNYNFSFVNGTLTVNKAALTITADNQVRLYGVTNPVLTVSYSGFANGETSSVLAGAPTVATTAATNSTAGSYAITVTNGTLASSNYNFSFVTGTLTVNKASLTVTADNQVRIYGVTNPVLTVSYNGFANGETSSVLAGAPSVTTIATTNSPASSYGITVTNGTLASSNYNFSFVNGTLTVNKASLTVTADNQARLYGATNPVLTASYSGFANGETASVLTGNPTTATTATTNSPAGSYSITVTNGSLASSNYNFSFVSGTLTVNKAALTITADNQVRLYGATNPVLTVGYSGFVNGENSGVLTGSPSVTTTATTNSPSGGYSITVTNGSLASSNYNFSFVSGTLTVNKAALTVTADNQVRLYGATNPVLTVSYSGFANGETSSVLAGAPSATTTATTNSPAGSYGITVTNGTLGSSNYNFSFVNGTLTVNKALLTVTADNQSRLYGATNPVLTIGYSGFANAESPGVLSGGPAISTTATTNSGIGNFAIVVTNGSLASANYNFSFVNGTLTINRALLTVTADNKSRVYGTTNPVLTASYSGFVNAETTNVLTGNPGLSTMAVSSSPAGNYPISATNGTLVAANYSFSFANGVLTVIATQPVIQSISRMDPSNMMVTWTSVSNVTYRLEYVPAVTSTNWQSVTPDVTATNTTASAVDNSGNAPQRYYRVFVVPQ